MLAPTYRWPGGDWGIVVRDTRLVQTAVIGDEHSDVPIVLPPEAIELDAFRRAHARDTFWCGLLLGGCGAQLADKLYVDRQCHFQHYPQAHDTPHVCRRRAVDESSADHLYVKSAMAQSLLEHGRASRFAFPPPIGALLDVDLEDGTRLRVHMNEAVPPDWTEGRTIVLGPGVVPDPGVFSGCPYVYRVRCESDGASRRVWIGTQSLAHPTEWVPLSDCVWTEDGLITSAAARLVGERPTAAGAAPAEAEPRSTPLPESVIRLILGLEAAQRTGTVEHMRRLCAGSGPFLESLGTAARAEAEHALQEARVWLAAHEDYQHRVFTELDEAVAGKRSWDVRSQLEKAAALTRRGASASEQRVLLAARAFLREQNHIPRTDSARIVPRPIPLQPPRPKSRRSKPQEVRKAQRGVPDSSRGERQAPRAAVVEVRSILQRLNHRAGVSGAEQRKLVSELSRALETAGDWLSDRERRAATSWIKKPPGPGRTGSHAGTALARAPQTRRDLAPDTLESAAAAVRGALKKAAREQTTTNWARLERQLGSALPHMTLADRIQVLILVDQTTPADQALLSSLVAAGDPDMMEPYRNVASALGLSIPADRNDSRDVLEADVQQVHDHWRHQ